MKPRTGLTVTASIISIILSAGGMIAFGYLLLFASQIGGILLPVGVELQLISIVGLLLNGGVIVVASILLAQRSKPQRNFGRGLAIALFVLNVVAIIAVIATLISGDGSESIALLISAAALYALSAVFLMLEITHNTRVINSKTPQNTLPTATQQEPDNKPKVDQE